MAIAFDAVTYAASEAATDPVVVSHTPVGTPRGVLVFITQGDSAVDEVGAVTYGGVSMTELSVSPHGLALGETGGVHAFFLGASIPTGAQNLSFVNGGAASKRIAIITYTAAADTEIQAADADILSAAISNPSGSIALSSATCAVAQAGVSGLNAPGNITSLSGWGTSVQDEYDLGGQISWIQSYNTIGSTDVTYGWTQSLEDAFGIAVAIKESAASGVTGTGSLTTATTTASGTGSVAHTGTGSLTTSTVTASGAGTLAHTGTGALTVSTVTLSGTGTLAHTGTGDLNTNVVTLAGAVVDVVETTDTHDGGGWLQPVKRRKQSKEVRNELERLFRKAEVVAEKVLEVEAPKQAVKPLETPSKTQDIGLPPIAELQGLLMHLRLIQDEMTGQQLEKLVELQQQMDFARMYNIRARAALLAA